MSHEMVQRHGSPDYCKDCHGVEGSSLTTECPGSPLSSSQLNGVYRGDLDYRDGEWLNPRAPAAAPEEPAAPAAPAGGHSVHFETEVEVPDLEPEPRVIHTTETRYVPVPVPIPVPIPLPITTNTDTEVDNSEFEDAEVDVGVNKR